MNLKPYDNYYDSNEKWIGIVPESWVVKPIREFYDYRSEKVSDKVYEPLSVTKQGILPQLEHAAKTDNNDARKKVKIGDFVINSRSDRKGSCGVSPFEGSVSMIYHVLNSKDPSINTFAHHLFRSVMFAEEFYKWGHGIVDDLWSTRWDEMKKIKIPMPPEEERNNIGKFLDVQTKNIDNQIDSYIKLASLLEEKHVALVNNKFLDINYPIVKLKDILRVGGYIRGPFGSSLKRDELKYEGFPIYEQQHAIHDSRIFRYYVDEVKYKELIRFKIKPNDLIISCSGTIGKVSIIKNNDPIGIISQALLILRINNNIILPEYLKYFLESHNGHNFLVSESNGAAQVNISQKDVINKIPIKLPPLHIQKQIVSELNYIDDTLNKPINKINKNIELLKEYKTSLIHHVVTGKVDVRGENI